MKLRLFTLILILFTIESNAQITLEHTFTSYVTWSGDMYFDKGVISSPNTYSTSTINNNEYSVFIYNYDYTINSTNVYSFTPPTGYEVSSVSMTKKLFNDDDNLEFLVTYVMDGIYDDTRSKLHLVNQNDVLIKNFGTSYMFAPSSYLHIADDEFRFLLIKHISDGTQQAEIYYVPGQVPENSINKIETVSNPPYPNPSNTMVVLPFEVSSNIKSTLKIFNSKGQIIKSIQIKDNTNKILLDVSGFSKGIYYYEVNGVTKKFIVN